ncbi:YopX family protein [Francisella philomiragia]|uniref:YopX family protein n=1 Tax=Francisella philomiragia TaxID=28110 RepID=UPI001C9DA6B8|nr:YopX family protein [Francisella philomiragia]MBY7733466.1 YopX family protein [Francisella philomiragia]
MRKIKFRGISKRTNDWVYGAYWPDCGTGPTIISRDGSTKDDFHLVDEKTVGQYIGLTDEHGNEIFEKDIVDDSSGEYTVSAVVELYPLLSLVSHEYDDGFISISVDDIDRYSSDDDYFLNQIVVVGNSHDRRK